MFPSLNRLNFHLKAHGKQLITFSVFFLCFLIMLLLVINMSHYPFLRLKSTHQYLFWIDKRSRFLCDHPDCMVYLASKSDLVKHRFIVNTFHLVIVKNTAKHVYIRFGLYVHIFVFVTIQLMLRLTCYYYGNMNWG